ncbi:MAG: C25 family cysteine peptidase [bacterium]|nr:C25 family cysteine peptidase [bacterium]
MKTIQALFARLLFVFLSFVPVFPTFATLRNWTTEDDIDQGLRVENSVQVHSEVLGIGHLRIQFLNPQVRFEQVLADKREWTFVTIDGESRIWSVGDPNLPSIKRAVRLPNQGNIKVLVHRAVYKDYEGMDVLPQQPFPEFKEKERGYKEFPFTINIECYNHDGWYPESITTVSEPAILRDARIAVLALQPVQYNPVTRVVRVYEEVEVEILPIGGVGENELIGPTRPVPSFAAFYRDILGADDLVLESQTAKPGSILIISRTSTTVMNIIQPFADWKTQSGRPTTILPPSGAGSSSSDVLSVIQNAYNTWNPPLEYVIIVGDHGTSGDFAIPAGNSSNYTDHNYTQLAGGDILGDITLGRFSVANATQLQTIVNRSVNYEKTPDMTDTTWFKRGWGYAGVAQGVLSNRPAIRFCNDMMLMHGVTEVYYDEHNGAVSTALINQRLGNGAVNWAHRAAWIGEISESNVSSLTNYNRPFVSFSITCATGNWTSGTGLNESLVRLGSPSAPTGAIASVATATSSTHPNYNNVVATGIYYGYGIQALHQPGPMLWSGKYQLWRNYIIGQSANVSNFSYWNNLMGDPTANLWSGVPQTLTANIPSTLGLGINRLEITVTQGTVPVNEVLVTAWKKNASGTTETYYRAVTDNAGRAVLYLTNQTTGTMLVTISNLKSYQNYFPIVQNVSITQNASDLTVQSISAIDDDNVNGTVGNSNGQTNPGETVEFTVTLLNRGTATATNISGTLVSEDPRIVVLLGNSNWSNINSGASQSGDRFRVQALAGLNDQDTIALRLDLTTSQGNRSLSVLLPIRSIKVNFVNYVLNGASSLNPGGSVQLSTQLINNGGLSTSGTVNATLSCFYPGITISNPTVSFPTMPVGTQVVNDANNRWNVSASTTIVPGTNVQFRVAIVNGSMRDTVTFTLPVGTRSTTDPTGPDSYGYYAYDNTDVAYSQAPIFSWVDIVQTANRLNLNDGGENQDANIQVNLPFTAVYYGQTYNQLTVCSNGWAAFGWQPYYNNFRNWHLPANEGPRNILAVFWDDLMFSTSTHGVYGYYDSSNRRYILTWNCVTTFGGNQPNEFQIIIYDPIYHPTPTGDSKILFQYRTFNNVTGDINDTDYATIGIADQTYTRAIEYSYYNQYTSGSSPISNGTNVNRAILFTTTQSDTLLRVISPNGGDSLAVSTSYTIRWRGIPNVPNVHIDLNRNYPTGTWERLFENTANDGSENWLVTNPLTNNARIRISSTNGQFVDDSDGPFVIFDRPILNFLPNPLTRSLAPGDSFIQTVTLQNTGNAAFTGTLTANTGTGGFGYQTSNDVGGPVYSWVNTASGTAGPTGDDATTGPFTLPFSFPFYGNNYSQVWMCTNGWITFNSTTANYYNSPALPDTRFQTLLAVFYDDLNVTGSGNTRVLMDAPNNRAIFSWNNVQRWGQSSTNISAQVILYSDGTIIMQYGQNVVNDQYTTVGVQGSTTQYINVYVDVPIPVNHAIRFRHSARWAEPSQTTFSIPSNSAIQFSVTWRTGSFANGTQLVGSYVFSGNAANTPYTVPVTLNVTNQIPEVNVQVNGVNVPDNTGLVDFGSRLVGQTTDVTFTIQNLGTGPLQLTDNPPVSTTGAFSVITQPNTTINANSSTTFVVRFTPTTHGVHTGTLSFGNTDSDENPYNFTLQGNGINPPQAPTNLTITREGSGYRLNWQAPGGTYNWYGIYRSTTGHFNPDTLNGTNLVDAIPSTLTTWLETQTNNFPALYYRVTAILAENVDLQSEPIVRILPTENDLQIQKFNQTLNGPILYRFIPLGIGEYRPEPVKNSQ